MTRPVSYIVHSTLEAKLVEGLRCGDLRCYRQLYELFAPRVRRLLLRLFHSAAVADDAVQATFLIAFEKAGQFDGRSAMLTWLTCIALREARRQVARTAREVGMEVEATVFGRTPEDEAVHLQASRQLGSLIDALPEEKRIALLLFEVEGLSVQEVADVLGEPRGTVLARLSRTRAELREAMREPQPRSTSRAGER